jgi:5-methylcytosine-specific restriction endonuclease McrA
MSHQTFFKPARGTWRADLLKRKAASKTEANKAIRQAKLAARKVEDDIRREVYARDGGWCRACEEALVFTGSLTDMMHAHHLVYRSAGGADDPSNRIALCFECHRDEHDHKLRISGDPNGLVEFRLVDLETGEVLRAWESDVNA